MNGILIAILASDELFRFYCRAVTLKSNYKLFPVSNRHYNRKSEASALRVLDVVGLACSEASLMDIYMLDV